MSFVSKSPATVVAALLLIAGSANAAEQFHIQQAIDQIDTHARELMDKSGIPGMAVAVVHGGKIVYARGFGIRVAGGSEPVDGDTVFQLASMSKPIGATVVASIVGRGLADWNAPIRSYMPSFTLGDPYVSANVTIADLYAHRSGLPDHAGDAMEELGFDRETILARLDQLPLSALRASYAYTNYGMTAAGVAVASTTGKDWPTLSEDALYKPLGMTRTSSRFADFQNRDNRALGHVKEQGEFVVGPERDFEGEQHWSSAYDTDIQSPSGGVSSSANDIARWMLFVLANGTYPDGTSIPGEAWFPAITPQSKVYQAKAPGERSAWYGYGFFINTTAGGVTTLSHGGAFAWGASTYFNVIPDADVGIVVLTNAWPTGVAEALVMQFDDIVLQGAPQSDWWQIYSSAMAGAFQPQGRYAGQQPPAEPHAAKPLSDYEGTYESLYLGVARVTAVADGLQLTLGVDGQQTYPLTHRDADGFTFSPLNDAAPPGSISAADFTAEGLRLEHFDPDGLGQLRRLP
ncbi:MAG TPA: serine hydrolase [Devosia sp.]|jgi:CubicO group peptidase (beta-lactamase class C family)|uniref:serine hydrolase n=1 Tax=Devosia sp. TaxID=1871048 RepID=UPI002DDC968F|nr:serine hydrolase [Devosia sp.]HEV2515800.1 serine hydrolase [Devosia sp.]